MKFRKKPIVIEAVQWKGHNTKEAFNFVGINNIIAFPKHFEIKTLEGNHKVTKGDWLIKGVKESFILVKMMCLFLLMMKFSVERTYEFVWY